MHARIAYKDGALNPSQKDGLDAPSAVRVRDGRGEAGLGSQSRKVAQKKWPWLTLNTLTFRNHNLTLLTTL